MVDMSLLIRFFAALYLSRMIPVYLKQCQAIAAKMAQISKFQGTLLTQATANIEALAKAEQKTHKGSPADTALRNDALALVQSDMAALKALVQSAADADLANAQSIIESSGMGVVKRVFPPKPPLAAKHGEVPGAAGLHAKKVQGALVYQWQMSSDQKAWGDLPWSKKASTSVSGLSPATVYYFRFRVLTADGTSDWSAFITYIAQ
jgi:hypothetical protein